MKCEVKVFSVVCDKCGETFDGTDGDSNIHTMRDVARSARIDGWKTGITEDLCPRCKTNPM